MKLIQSRANPFFKSLKRLAESGRERRRTGRTLLDGVHLVAAYEALNGPVETLVVSESALAGGEIADFVGGRAILVLADSLLRDLGLVETPSGLLAVAGMPVATVSRIPAMSERSCAPRRRRASGRLCSDRAARQPGRPRCCGPGRARISR